MTEPIETSQGADELTFRELAWRARLAIEKLRASAVTILRIAAPFVAVGLFLAFGSPSEYRAEMRILPYRNGGSGAALGLLAGLKLPTGLGDQFISGDLYPEIVRSTDFRVALARTPLQFSDGSTQITPERYFLEIREHSPVDVLLKYTIGLPALLLAPKLSKTKVEAYSGVGIPSYDWAFRSVLAELQARVLVEVDLRSGVVVASATMPDAYAAADLVRAATDLLLASVVTLEAQQAREQLDFLESQHRTLSTRYERTQLDLAAFQDRNRALFTAVANLEVERLQRERDLTYQLYQQVSMDVEQARFKVAQATPVFTVIDHPIVPGSRHSPRRAFTLLAFSLIGLVAGAIRVLVR